MCIRDSGNSFEIFSKINIKIPVIFTTAYDQYAIKAFKQNSIDYLLKPISLTDVQFALEKYDSQHNTHQTQIIENMMAAYHQINKTFKIIIWKTKKASLISKSRMILFNNSTITLFYSCFKSLNKIFILSTSCTKIYKQKTIKLKKR